LSASKRGRGSRHEDGILAVCRSTGVGSGGLGGPIGEVTHITGSIPGAGSNIVAASGRFRKLKDRGRVRLSGAVNVDSFFGTDDAQMAFSCIFVIMD
jgi:hypothetical protein